MSIASEISRLQTAKADIKTAIENKGVTVADNLTISSYASKIDEIQTGADILNGIIKQYKAYTTGANVTVSANTFIEFINVPNEKEFNTGLIKLLDKLDSAHLFMMYMSYSNSRYRVYGAVISIGATIDVISAEELYNPSSDYGYSLDFKYVKNGEDYVVFDSAYGYAVVNIDSNYNITLVDTLSTGHTGDRYLNYLTSENGADYYVLSTVSSGQVNLYTIKVENNSITELASPLTVFNGSSSYAIGSGNVYVDNGKLLVTCSQNNTFYYYFYTFSNETYTLVDNNSIINMNNIGTARENNKLYVFYRYNDIERLMTFTINFNNSTLTSDNNSIELFSATSAIDSKIFITDRLWFFAIIESGKLSAYTFNKSTIAPIQNKDILTLPNYIYSIVTDITMCPYNDEFIISIKHQSDYGSTVYNLTTQGDIVIGGDYVVPSQSKIEGLTKTDCTDGVAGDVWVLNRGQ